MALREHPICQMAGCSDPSEDVHHEDEDPARRLDTTNLTCLCHSCHSRITRARQLGRNRL